MAINQSTITFTEAMSRLREIVSLIEENNPDVDELISLAEEAVELIRFCKEKLTATNEKVTAMLKTLTDEEEKP